MEKWESSVSSGSSHGSSPQMFPQLAQLMRYTGGCRIYTGAPYYAAQSSLLCGSDLAWVFCTQSASPTIKAYSPDLIVLPFLPEAALAEELCLKQSHGADIAKSTDLIRPWLSKLSCLIVGPGLGDDPLVQATALNIITEARDLCIPLVIDGSAFNLFSPSNINIIKGYEWLVLTPNISELGRLAKAAGLVLDGPMGAGWQNEVKRIGQALEGPMILSKGPVDVLSDGKILVFLDGPKVSKRCGGQGDILVGSLGTFLSWTMTAEVGSGMTEKDRMIAACSMATKLTRGAAYRAFRKKGRSMTASALIEEIPDALVALLEDRFM